MLSNLAKSVIGGSALLGGTGTATTVYLTTRPDNYVDYNFFSDGGVGVPLSCSTADQKFEYPKLTAESSITAKFECAYESQKVNPDQELKVSEQDRTSEEISKLTCKLEEQKDYRCTHPTKKVTLSLENEGKTVKLSLGERSQSGK
nr:hypothetical protein [Candidatus Mycoplasma haematolamae]